MSLLDRTERHRLCQLTLLLILIMTCAGLQAQGKGLHREILQAKTQDGESLSLYTESHALLIGVSEYTHWPRLDSIPAELDEVEDALIAQEFNVVRLNNPKGRELSNGVEDFINEYGLNPENRLLIYYSGHGHSIGEKGFLLPADTPLPEDKAFRRETVPMSRVMSWARDIEAKHVLFLFDSCFSGTVFKSRELPKNRERYIRGATAEPVRQFITAGSADQAVPASSTFTPAFVNAINGEGDLNKDGYITGTELGVHLSQLVPQFVDQTPQYGKIKDYGLAQGDFVFFKQVIQVNAPTAGGSNDSLDTRLWQSAENGNTVEEYQAYIEQYPDGNYTRMAKARIKLIKQNQEISQKTVEDATENNSGKLVQLQTDCDTGGADACGELGYIYRNGIGVAKDEALAAVMAMQGCDAGSASACTELSYLYRTGIGVEKDEERAFTLIKPACTGENTVGCASLAYMYRKGLGVTKDEARAALAAKHGCDGGRAQSCAELGYMYREGIGVKKNKARALKLAKKGCDGGSADACNDVKYIQQSH